MNKPAKAKKSKTAKEAPETVRDDADENVELDADELGVLLWGALGDDSPMRGAGGAAL